METETDVWDWDAWLDQADQHVTNIRGRLNQGQHSQQASRSPALISPESGHLTGGELCWVCYATTPHRGRRLPKFRACIWCLRIDRRQAARLGLKMLLPLMKWHSQPVLPGGHYPTDKRTIRALTDIWASSKLLDEWRRENVKREYALLVERTQQQVHLADWYRIFGYGPQRSQDRWSHFLYLYFPEHVDHLGLSV